MKIKNTTLIHIPDALKVMINKKRSKYYNKRPFYTAYPYVGHLKIDSVDWRGIIDFDLGIFFNRIPKSANSTVVVNLAELRFGKEIPSWEAKRMFMYPSQVSSHQMQNFKKLFKFTVVRNPYTRVLSAYLDKILRQKKNIRSFSGKFEGTPSFLDFCKYLEQGGIYGNPHWAPQTSLLLLPLKHYDYIGKVETLSKDLQYIFHNIAPNRNYKNFRSHVTHKTDANKKVEKFYDDQCRKIVGKIYKSDFDTFGYET